MKSMMFRVPFEARVKVASLVDYAYKAKKDGIPAHVAFNRLLNGLLALDSMLDRIDAEWWDAMDMKGEQKTREDFTREES